MFAMKTLSKLLVAIFLINYCHGARISLEQAATDELKWYDDKETVYANDLKQAMTEQRLPDVMATMKNISGLYKELVNGMNKYAANNFNDPTLKRQIKVILNGFQSLLTSDEYLKLMDISRILEDLSKQTNICQYENRHNCNWAYLPQIKSVYARSHDPNELQYYWKEWRDKHLETAINNYKEFIYLYRKAASLAGFNVPSESWYSMFEDSNFIHDMEHVMSELTPFYKELHAYVRHVLKQKYGDVTVSEVGPIPEHLMEQILIQAWNKNSLLEQPFPAKRLPNLKAGLQGHDFDSHKIIRTSAEFFDSMGFTPFNETFWNYFVRQKTRQEAGEDCKAEITVDNVIEIKYCPKAYFKQFLQMHGFMAQAEYKILARNQPFGLRDEACPGFSNAIGEAVILSASTPKHIERIGILTDYHYDNELSLNRLFRLGIHTMFKIPTYFVNDKFITNSLNDQFNLSEPNCYYWSLMNHFAGVEPPLNRSRNSLDVSYKFYEDIADNHQTKKFISEVVGYQIYRALCLNSGQFVRGDPNRPLQNCDFYGNREIGNILKEAMSLGRTKHWYEILKMITGDETISGGALLEFYDPLFMWLKEQNAKNGVYAGWTNSAKCH